MALTLSRTHLHQFRRALLDWYDAHRRDLPWRQDRDPYHVWVSEIMLQQTQVAAVLDHYAKFVKRFPAVRSLAAAREQSVLAVWSGLGYYHRARRMHEAAKMVVREYGGNLPSRSEDWLNLPGIGRYTAAAIASISFGESIAVVDGNVERVLGRLQGKELHGTALWDEAEQMLDPERPGDFNQAMMELGAILCTPRAPQCLLCPVARWCGTRGEEPRKPQPARKRKQLCYAFVQKDEAVLLVQRDANSKLMAGMWELPEIDSREPEQPIAKFKHSITDTDYQVLVFHVDHLESPAGRWFTREQWNRLAVTGLARKILRKLHARPRESNKD